MKAILVLTALFAGFAHAADTEERRIERSRQVLDFEIPLNASNVRCLIGDYGSKSLKISVPELIGYTVFRQTTSGETAPCINAGSCQFGKTPDGRRLDPSLIIDPARPTEVIHISVVLEEVLSIDHVNKTCFRSLTETLDSPVRGLNFKHVDGASLGDLPYETCLTLN